MKIAVLIKWLIISHTRQQMKPLILPVTLDNYNPRKDRTTSLRFITQELTADQVADLHRRIDHFGVLYFKNEQGISDSELKQLEELDVEIYDAPKSLSQRLRSTLYVLWQQQGEQGEFAEFYKTKMNRLIDHFKGQLV